MKSLILVLPLTLVVSCAGTSSKTTPLKIGKSVEKKDDSLIKDYENECAQGLEKAKLQFSRLEGVSGEKSIDTVLLPLNELWMTIDSGVNRAGLFAAVHPNQAVRDAANICEQDYRKLITTIGLSRRLYDAVALIDLSDADTVTKRYVKNVLRDFRRSGVDKDEATREKVRALTQELVEIGQAFGKNIRSSVRTIELDSVKELEGLPQDYIDAHQPGPNGKIVLTTNYPDYIPFMTYAKNDALRLKFYKEFRKRGHPENGAILDRLLAKRYELATLLGYKNWADYITEDKMIKSEVAAAGFIEKISTLSKQRSLSDYEQLLRGLQKEMPEATFVGDWQKAYVENLVKQEEYQLDTQSIREYFTYDKVRKGIFDITGKMFGVRYLLVTDAKTWHSAVETYDVLDIETDSVIGRFHLDMHPRDDKYKHAAAFPLQSGVEGIQIPVASLVCNFPEGEQPMEHAQVETFFHEFGHLIHHLFGGKHKWVGVSGFNTEWDFVEAPSQMLEEWAWDAATLKSFAKDKAGNPIPDELVAAMNRARDFGKGLWVQHQMFYAAVSLNFYNRDPREMDTTVMMKELQEKYSPFDYVDDTFFHYSFGHLDGYSAIYYTYMWSLVIAKDLFSVFQEAGLWDKAAASRYRNLILRPGGSKDAAEMVRDFLDRDYSFDAFSKWLSAG